MRVLNYIIGSLLGELAWTLEVSTPNGTNEALNYKQIE